MQAVLRAGAAAAVSAPASAANLGPGFDCVGLALGLRDEYAVEVTTATGLVVDIQGAGSGHLPRDERLLVAKGLRTALQACGIPWLDELTAQGLGLRLQVRTGIPLSAGLGSSAASVVGGLGLGFALARGGSLTNDDLTLVNTHAGLLEGHPDNSSAATYGGLTVSWQPSSSTVRTARLRLHDDIDPVVLVPTRARLATRTARAALPPHVPFADAVRQSARAALLTHALTTDPTLLLDATQDWLHQEYRRASYPTSMAAVDLLRSLGHPATVSGAGPSVVVLALRGTADSVVAEARSWGREWRILRPGVDTDGLHVREVSPTVPA
ncbi:MAG TPA: homoserine kinase [Ornithinicoccus sp.]|jgi:homoserine kinase|nr:homoserine kinase [Ornithinicoccus sp.]